jgi:soluble lytic murein transglycosylase
LAQAAADDADYPTATLLAKRLLQEYPQGVWRDAGLWLLGWAAYKQRMPKDAADAWARLIAEEPGSRFRAAALYWRGRALEALRQPAEAGKSYRTLLDTAPDQYYYRMRAADRTAALAAKRPTAAPVSLGPLAPPGPAPTGLHAEKARALRRLGLTEEAADEWSEQVRERPDERSILAHACAGFLDLQRFDRALWLTSRYLRPLLVQQSGQLPIRNYWHCAYPLGYADLVRPAARGRGLDPHLVLAVIREESAFAPRATSRAGARGLMQLMPQTADLVARQHKLPAPVGRLEIPQVNIQLGTLHLADLVEEHSGIPSLALAAYNAGKPPVQRWLARYGFADEVEFLEDIPYAETRNYVKRVLGNQERYRSLYGSAPAESAGGNEK